MQVLIVSSDSCFILFAGRGLRELGDRVDEATRGVDGFFLASTHPYDAIILDWALPDITGLTLLRFLRVNKIAIPILTVSGQNDVDHTIASLDAGGDDHLARPVIVAELAARLRAISRRGPVARFETVLAVGDLRLDKLTRRVTRGNTLIVLQPRPFQLLSVLMAHEDEVVTRTTLLERVWEYHFDPRTSVVETHISRLRRKIDAPFDRKLIHTVRGGGYMITARQRCSAAAE